MRAGHKWKGKNEDPYNLQYRPRRRDLIVRYLLYIPIVCLTGSETILVHEKRLQNLEADRKQNESICKSLARFSTQFRVKIVLNFCLLGKLKNLVINHATVWQQKNFKF